jgi:hypothetical protein
MPLAVTTSGGHAVLALGLILGVLGGLMVAVGAYVVLRGTRNSSRSLIRLIERSATLVGFLLIAVSLVIQLGVLGVHSLR